VKPLKKQTSMQTKQKRFTVFLWKNPVKDQFKEPRPFRSWCNLAGYAPKSNCTWSWIIERVQCGQSIFSSKIRWEERKMSELASVMFDGRCFETEVAQKLAVSRITFARSRLLTRVVFIFAFFPTGFFWAKTRLLAVYRVGTPRTLVLCDPQSIYSIPC